VQAKYFYDFPLLYKGANYDRSFKISIWIVVSTMYMFIEFTLVFDDRS